MNVIREVSRLNEEELKRGIVNTNASWHFDYKDTCWIFVGNLNKELCEGDVICVMSQFGEIEDLHLIRDEETGESKGFCFIKYEQWGSTVLAIDNFNGVELRERVLRVDHAKYEPPKKKKKVEGDQEHIAPKSIHEKLGEIQPGHAYKDREKIDIEGEYSINQGFDAFASKQEDKKSSKKHHKKSKKKQSKEDRREFTKHEPIETKQPLETAQEKRRRLALLAQAPAASWNGH